MISSIEIFSKYKEVFVPSYTILPEKKNDTYCLTLLETDPQAFLKEITVTGVPVNSILLDLGKLSELKIDNKLNHFINDDKGVFQCCDFLLISDINGKLHLIFIELKSGIFNRSNVVRQFKGAACFTGYINSILHHFYDFSVPRNADIHFTYALFSSKNTNKKSTEKTNKYRKSLSPDEYIHKKFGKRSKGITPFSWFLYAISN